MENFLKKSLLIGIGALSLTKERMEDLAADLAVRGEESTEETKKFLKELVEKGEEGRTALKEIICQEMRKIKEGMGLVTKEELAAMEKRLESVETALNQGGAEPPI